MPALPFRLVAALLAVVLCPVADAAPAGTPDPAFGGGDGGTVVPFDLDDDSQLDTVHAIVAAPGGFTYLVGLANTPANPQFPAFGGSAIAIARLTHAGKPDVHFGTLGRVVHADASVAHLVMQDAALAADGQLVTAGYALAQSTRMAACRFLPDGSDDAGFGDAETPGCTFLDLDDDSAMAHAVLALPDGRIALGGENAQGDAIVVLLDANGARVPGFGTAGVRTLGTGVVADLALAADDTLVAAGTFDAASQGGFVAKLAAGDGGDIAGFGIVPFDHAAPGGNDSFVAVTVDTHQRVLATGWTEDAGITRPLVVRFDPDGTRDTTFATNGVRTFAPAQPTHRRWLDDIATDASDTIHLAGRDIAWPGNTFTATAVALRLHPDGSDDASYGNAGTAVATFDHVEPTDVHLALQGGRITLATSVGDGPLPPLTADFGAFRFDHGLHLRHRVTPHAGPGGALKPNAAQTVAHGDVTPLLVAPKPGFVLDHIEGCGGALSGKQYIAGPVIDDCVVIASFKPGP